MSDNTDEIVALIIAVVVAVANLAGVLYKAKYSNKQNRYISTTANLLVSCGTKVLFFYFSMWRCSQFS